MGKSKTTSHIQTLASRSKKSAAGEKHKSTHGASTTSAGKAAETTAYQPLFANIAKVMCQGGAAFWQLALAFKVDENTIRGKHPVKTAVAALSEVRSISCISFLSRMDRDHCGRPFSPRRKTSTGRYLAWVGNWQAASH
jgi:hypothetical protein